MLRDILKGDDPQVLAVLETLAHVDADVLVLGGIDWDADGAGLAALNAHLGYPHSITARPNRGLASGFDIDGDGRLDEAEDRVGFADFTGQEGLVVLSRRPVTLVADLGSTPWGDVPNALGPPDDRLAALPVSTTAHWQLAIDATPPLTLLAWHATPPVFDGPEDRNGRRNHDEAVLWLPLIDDRTGPLVLAGFANLDTVDGDGRPDALRALLDHPDLIDLKPGSDGALTASREQGGVNARHQGDPRLDTADWPDEGNGPGNLRVDYLLPSRDLRVTGSGVLWPAPDDPLHAAVVTASRHRIVWLDLDLPAPP